MKTITFPKVKSKTGQFTNFQIKNVASTVLMGTVGLALFAMSINQFSKSSGPGACLMLAGAAILLARSRVHFNGVKIDKQSNTISFPGGGISPNGFFHILSPRFILQYFLVHTIKLSDVEMVTYEDRIDYDKNGKEIHKYGVNVMGSFGVVFIKMESINKAKSLYSALINILDFDKNV